MLGFEESRTRIKAGYCRPCSAHTLPLPSLTELPLCTAAHDGEEKNPDLTNSRPKEQAGEFPGGITITGGVAFWAGAGQMVLQRSLSPEATLGSLSVTESVGSASGAQSSSQKGTGHLGRVANTERFPRFRWN